MLIIFLHLNVNSWAHRYLLELGEMRRGRPWQSPLFFHVPSSNSVNSVFYSDISTDENGKYLVGDSRRLSNYVKKNVFTTFNNYYKITPLVILSSI